MGIIFITEVGLIAFGPKSDTAAVVGLMMITLRKVLIHLFFIYIPTLTGGISTEINIGGPKILNRPDK